jgi:hypothetical protein
MTLLQIGPPLNAAEVRRHFVIAEHNILSFTWTQPVFAWTYCVALKCTYVPNRNVHQGTI